MEQFDADGPHEFEPFFAMAKQLRIVDELQLEVLRRAVQTGRRTERKCISEYWAQVAAKIGMSGRYPYRCEMSVAALAEAPEEDAARAREEARSPRHSGSWLDEKGSFSLAKCLEPLVTPRWLVLKQRGTDALEAGECEVAATWYGRAAAVTDHATALDAFFDHLETCANHTARRLAELQDDLWPAILKRMPDGPRRLAYTPAMEKIVERDPKLRAYVHEPNLPRAICHANAAAARLRQLKAHDEDHAASMARYAGGLPPHIRKMGAQIRVQLADVALKAAEDAAMVCPEYQKGHHRVLSALKAKASQIEQSGDDDATLMEAGMCMQKAADVETAMRHYDLAHGHLPWSGIAVQMAGFLHEHEYERAYARAYLDHEMRTLKQAADMKSPLTGRPYNIPMLVIVKASLVPCGGGQALLICVERRQEILGRLEAHNHDGLCFRTLDPRHGDIVEAPPHGRASKQALRNYPPFLSRFLADLKHMKIDVDEICMGQALRDQVQQVKAALDAEGVYRDVRVYASATTHASKVAAPGGREREEQRFWENGR